MILYFAGNQWVEPKDWEQVIDTHPDDPAAQPGYAAAKAEIDHTRLFDCATKAITNPGSPDADLFCCGHSLLADGRLITAGGTQHWPIDGKDLHAAHWSGTLDSWLFEPHSAGWLKTGSLNEIPNPNPNETQDFGVLGGGRWYPTVITLASGHAMAHCGHPVIGFFSEFSGFDTRHNNTTPEVFDPANNAWTVIDTALGVSEAHDYAPYYPRMHVIPGSGDVLVVQPLYSKTVTYSDPPKTNLESSNPLDTAPPYHVDVKDNSLFYSVTTRQVTAGFPGPQSLDPIYLNTLFTSQQTTSVMLPLLHEENYRPFVLLCGAVQPLIADLAPSSEPIRWIPTPPRALTDPATGYPPVRNFANATLLPTGDVVVTGGVTKYKYQESDGVRAVEIFNRATGWVDQGRGPSACETRGYHSSALLMPDGRVWTAGGEEEWNNGIPNLSIELFEPDYYSVADRVAVVHSPSKLTYGESFTVTFSPTKAKTPIERVALLRNGSCTHAFDADQRYVSVPFTSHGTRLTVTAPPNATIAPPGFYMLWLIDRNGLPCKLAPFIQLTGQVSDISYIFPVTLG